MDQKNRVIGVAIIVVLIFIGIGGFLWWNGTSKVNVADQDVDTGTTTTTSLAEKAYTQTRVKENGVYVTTVNYTDDGFVPPIVYINRGEAVRFVNKSAGSMRIATNVFQELPLYSGFGQEKSVGTGGKYEFNFTQKGVWGYNNLNSRPTVYGIVYVR